MADRIPLMAGNWKMYKTAAEAKATVAALAGLVSGASGVEVMIAPPFTALAAVAEAIKDSPIALGAQNMFWEAQGAFTGEISPTMLVAAGCRYVILGHSERRQYFGETDATVNKRIKSAVKNGLCPVFCLGETQKEREAGETFSVLDKQLKIGLEGMFAADLKGLVVAYEPVWAIGTGKTATAEQAQEVHRFLRDQLAGLHGQAFADGVRIQYGGSVKPNNVAVLMSMTDIDGALVGGASLDADTFGQIVNFKTPK